MKLLVLFAVAAASGVGVTSAAVALGNAGTGATSAPPQHLTMRILDDADRMVGPNLLVQPGPVVLRIVNYAHHAHTFSVPRLHIERFVPAGSPTRPTVTVVRFVAPYGTFAWYCRLPCGDVMSGDVYASWRMPRMHSSLWATSG